MIYISVVSSVSQNIINNNIKSCNNIKIETTTFHENEAKKEQAQLKRQIKSTSSGESATKRTESSETEATESNDGSVTFDFTIRFYGGDDETVLTSCMIIY